MCRAGKKQADEAGTRRMAALMKADQIWKNSFDEAKPYTLNPQPSTPHPTTYTLHLAPQNLNPKP